MIERGYAQHRLDVHWHCLSLNEGMEEEVWEVSLSGLVGGGLRADAWLPACQGVQMDAALPLHVRPATF